MLQHKGQGSPHESYNIKDRGSPHDLYNIKDRVLHTKATT